MELDIALDRKDHETFSLYLLKHSPSAKRNSAIHKLLLPLFLLIVIAALQAGKADPLLIKIMCMTSAAATLIWLAAFNKIMERRTRRQVNQSLDAGKKPFTPRPTKFQLAEDRIVDEAQGLKNEVAYGEVERIVSYEKYTYIFLSGTVAFVIPDRAFAAPNQKRQFLKMLTDKTGLQVE